LDITDMPERVPPEELDRLRDLGRQVSEAIASAGLPVTFESDPLTMPPEAGGAHVYLDVTIAGAVFVRWECSADLRSRALTASTARNYDSPDVRVHVAVLFAMADALVRLLTEAGYEAGTGVDMAESHVWVKPGASAESTVVEESQ
jgi:hypothetical protein